MRARLQTVLDKLASLPQRSWEQRHKRVVRNCYLSFMGWLVMYGVFIVEVSRLNFDSQHAKLSISPLSAPLGLTIQWLVFRDRISVAEGGTGLWRRAKQVCVTAYNTVRQMGLRWAFIRYISFFVNQYAYAMMLHAAGLPYWLAYPVAASALSLIYYKMNKLWVFTDEWWRGPVMSRICYYANTLWLRWNIGPSRQAETA
jgi:hypothetical protein